MVCCPMANVKTSDQNWRYWHLSRTSSYLPERPLWRHSLVTHLTRKHLASWHSSPYRTQRQLEHTQNTVYTQFQPLTESQTVSVTWFPKIGGRRIIRESRCHNFGPGIKKYLYMVKIGYFKIRSQHEKPVVSTHMSLMKYLLLIATIPNIFLNTSKPKTALWAPNNFVSSTGNTIFHEQT